MRRICPAVNEGREGTIPVMRYLSLILMIVAMYCSWSFIQKPAVIAESTHANIQENIKDMVLETMKTHLPTVKDFRFERFWTERLDADKIAAFFTCSFENSAEEQGDTARYGVEGYATLTYDPVEEIWEVEGPVFNNNEIAFKDGITIKPGAAEETAEETEETSGE